MDRNMSQYKREWVCACIFFSASACFLVVSATGRDAYYFKLIAGLTTWVAGFVSLIRLRPSGAAQLDAGADGAARRSSAS